MADQPRAGDEGQRSGVVGLLRRIPELIRRLVHDEVQAAKAELSMRLKAAGVGIGITVAGAVLALYALGALVTSAIGGLDTALPHWLSALIVGVALLVIAGILALLGVKRLQKGVPPVPKETIENVKADIRAVKGEGRG